MTLFMKTIQLTSPVIRVGWPPGIGRALGQGIIILCLTLGSSPSRALTAPVALAGPFGLQGLGGNCLDVRYANSNPGAAVDNGACNRTSAQVFTFKNGTIQSAWGQCLDVLYGNAAAGKLDWATCNGTASQLWHQVGLQIVGLAGKCLDVLYGNVAPATTVDLATCNGTPAQNWQVINAPTILTSVGSKCLDIINSNKSPGAKLQIFECNRGPDAQIFTFTAANEIRNRVGECLDVMYGSAPGGQVQMTGCNGMASQHWIRQGREIRTTVNNFSLTGYCLGTVQSYNSESSELESGLDHTPVGLVPCDGLESQQWVASDLFQDPPATLLIVTSNAFQSTFNTFIAHKQSIGIATTLLTMTYVHSTFPATDDALSLKKAIDFYYRNYGTTYVLLGGDTSQVPIRYRRELDGGGKTQSFVFSDLYYANLYSGHLPNSGFHGNFDTWDANGDGFYDDQSWDNPLANPDNVDGFPDLAIGRIPAYSTVVLTAILNKIITYENLNPGSPVHYGWVADACYPGYSDISQIASSIGASVTNSSSAFAEETAEPKCQSAPSGWIKDTPGWTVFQWAFDHNTFNWVIYVGHGGSSVWGYYGTYNSSQTVKLTNSLFYPLVVAAACQTAKFANVLVTMPLSYHPGVYDPQAIQYSQPNIGSQFLFNPNGGAVAYMGENQVEEDDAGTDFTEKLLYQYRSGYDRLGDMWRMAQQAWFNANFETPKYDQHFTEPRIFLGTFNLLGDPSMRLH